MFRTRLAAISVSALFVTAGAIATSAPASAHAELKSTSPEAGSTVPATTRLIKVTFDDVVKIVPRSLSVRTQAAQSIATSKPFQPDSRSIAVRLLSAPAAGQYLATWRALSDDGHIVAGSFLFAIKAPAKAGAASTAGSATSATAPTPAGKTAHGSNGMLIPAIVIGLAVAAGALLYTRRRPAIDVVSYADDGSHDETDQLVRK